ncbi:putative inner membrane protein [Phaeobacter sp. CECT 5382]|uniref:YeeE/YedE family protein n=1 Tax=Rhodobacterales TaxID=204455 RepID=UPI0006DB71AF|nr:YeeE/YedE family protein [Phaeobacter sp. CECT 5382]CUH86397.1 putative inner membrane protein [Phaeobacter sp. CECT 5382]
MFETFGFEDTSAREVSVLFALGLGLVFGLLAQITRFCFRRAVVGEDRRQAAGVWALALAVSVLGTQGSVAMGWINFEGHRLLASDLPLLAIVLGGVMFGTGMVLTRGCISRLTVLSATGNLRALLCVGIFAIIAHATLKGVLAPLRTLVSGYTVPLGDAASLAALPGGAQVWSLAIALPALWLALRSENRATALLGGALIGALVPLAWVGTGFVLFDEFDPIAMESLSFTAPMTEGLFYVIAASAVPAGFGPGLMAGALGGALIAALLRREFQWQSFENPRQTGRYMLGAALMGFGGVLAGGCTLGAGLAGISTLGVAALLALTSIGLGGWAAHRLLQRRANAASFAPAAPQATPAPQPAA